MEDYNTNLVPDEKIEKLYTIAFFDKGGNEVSLTEVVECQVKSLYGLMKSVENPFLISKKEKENRS
ncbi:MAG: hypothetical protein Q8Q04_02395 [archaeon]|nr:hypothetical protein [archaeon]